MVRWQSLAGVQKNNRRLLKTFGLNRTKDCFKIESPGYWGKENVICSEKKWLLRSKIHVKCFYLWQRVKSAVLYE